MSDVRSEIDADLARLADRLRSAPLAKVEPAVPDARAALQRLADLAAGTAARHDETAPAWRTVPELPVAALGDQVAVLGLDLQLALAGAGDDELVWTPGGRRELGPELSALAEALAALRRSV